MLSQDESGFCQETDTARKEKSHTTIIYCYVSNEKNMKTKLKAGKDTFIKEGRINLAILSGITILRVPQHKILLPSLPQNPIKNL